jgi:hypothetical protein
MRAPSGYIFNRQLFDRIGRERHADAWTGIIEHTARQDLTTIEQYETDCITPGLNHSGSGMGGFVVRQWTPEMSEKHRAEIYSDVYQAERAARTRYDDVFVESLSRLECGLLKAAVLDTNTGRIHALAPQHWRTRRAEDDLAKSKGPISETRTGVLLIAETPAQEPTATALLGDAEPSQGEQRKMKKRGSAADAVKAAFPGGVPTSLQMSNVVLCRKVRKHLPKDWDGHDHTIERAAGRRK